MKTASKSLQSFLDNSQHRPDITGDQYKRLPRIERLYYAVVYPRYFQMSAPDLEHLELVKQAYNIMVECGGKDEDKADGAKIRIKHMVPGRTLGLSEILELMRDAKAFFGRVVVTDADYDRNAIRRRLWELVELSRKKDDLFEERLALEALMKLDGLAVNSKKDTAPVIPPMPEIEYTENFNESDAAIIIASSEKEDMDQS